MLKDQLQEAYFYLIFAGIDFALLFGLLALALVPWRLVRKQGGYASRLFRTALFLGLLWGWGGLANGIWFALPTERWYVQGDPLVRYLPIAPFGQWTLGERWGGHLQPGVSMLGLQALWLLFSLGVWSLSWLCYGRLRPRHLAGGEAPQEG